MNIKSLLFGSVAALTAASGAQAADAVVAAAEAEPVEYVRVCDAYGAGYIFIPGTETCLRISGYLRYDIGFGDALGLTALDRKDNRWRRLAPTLLPPDEDVDYHDTWNKRARFTLRTHTASETELGTLRTYTETRFQWDSNQNSTHVFTNADDRDQGWGAWAENDPVTLNFAYIELGGLRIGKDETAFRTYLGYAGSVINDDVIEPGGYDTTLISYTFAAGDGISAIVSLEQGSDWWTIDSYMPHVVVGAKWTQGWGSFGVVGGYDSNVEEYAIKARADLNVTDEFAVWVMGGWQTDGGYDHYQDNFYASWGGDWIGWVGGSYKFTPQASLNAQFSYDDAKQMAAVVNVAYELVPGLVITPEALYVKSSEDLHDNDDDMWGGMLRFQRSF